MDAKDLCAFIWEFNGHGNRRDNHCLQIRTELQFWWAEGKRVWNEMTDNKQINIKLEETIKNPFFVFFWWWCANIDMLSNSEMKKIYPRNLWAFSHFFRASDQLRKKQTTEIDFWFIVHCRYWTYWAEMDGEKMNKFLIQT